MKLIVIAALLLAMPSSAQEVFVTTQNYTYLLLAVDTQRREIFAMSPGACLRGPLFIKNDKGENVFELAGGADFPAGCSRQ